MDSQLYEMIAEWRAIDKDPKSLEKLDALIQAGEFAKLRKSLNAQNRLEFGTAGLRGELAPGYNCMNTVTIMQTVQGLCAYCKKHFPEQCKNGIVVCRDARHYSDVFAEITAGVFIEQGIKVYYFTQLSSTPYAAYFTEKLHCVCGVMVTASHNPAYDNGYKVYGMNCGIQVVAPHDIGIYNEILNNQKIRDVTYRYKEYMSAEYEKSGLFIPINEQSELVEDYYTAVAPLCFHKEQNADLALQIYYSAMWGVGYELFRRTCKTFNLQASKILHFADSAFPDPDFGGEPRPNPEERHNMENLARKADPKTMLIIANDPDADRMGIAERQPNGEFYIFHGNETGALLAEWMLENTAHVENRAIACSTVSSQILGKMAEHYKVDFKDTLTGFKWLGLYSKEWLSEGKNMVFGFEESIGFSCGGKGGLKVGDKDGVATACVVCEMANIIYKRGLNLHAYLMKAYERYGYYSWNNTGFSVASMDEVKQVFNIVVSNGDGKFVANGRNYISKIGRFTVNRIRDMKNPGYDSEFGLPKIPVSSSEMVTFYTDEVTSTLRPSGTEPKVKLYVEATSHKGCSDAKAIAQEFTAKFMELVGRK